MKAPKGVVTGASTNAHIANEKAHQGNGCGYDKIQKIKINPDLYKRIEKVADKRKVVLSDVARSALDFYLNNPDAPYSEKLSTGNSKQIIYNINVLMDELIEKFKANHGVNRSDQLRKALSAWLIHEKLLNLEET